MVRRTLLRRCLSDADSSGRCAHALLRAISTDILTRAMAMGSHAAASGVTRKQCTHNGLPAKLSPLKAKRRQQPAKRMSPFCVKTGSQRSCQTLLKRKPQRQRLQASAARAGEQRRACSCTAVAMGVRETAGKDTASGHATESAFAQ
eukprot:4814970-Pleurochrysis_carterae.AAC.2